MGKVKHKFYQAKFKEPTQTLHGNFIIFYTRLLSLLLRAEHCHFDQVLLNIEFSTYHFTCLIVGSFPQTSFCLLVLKS